MKASMTVNNPTDGPPLYKNSKRGKLQGAIKAVNVREKPDMNSPVKFILRDNVSFEFSEISTTSDWYEVYWGFGIGVAYGYVMSKYVVDVSGDTS